VTISRPTEIGAGDEVRLGDRTATVVAVTGTGMQLQDITGQQFTITRGELLASPGFQVITARTAPLPPSGLLDGIPEEAAEKARWWERHIAEVRWTGASPWTAEPRPEYDPMATTLRQRELAKGVAGPRT
jgi:putative transposase